MNCHIGNNELVRDHLDTWTVDNRGAWLASRPRSEQIEGKESHSSFG